MFAEGYSKHIRLGLGKFSPTWLASMAALFLVFAFGVYAYSRQLTDGETITGMRTLGSGGVAWGLYIVFVIFFVGIGFAGISISAIIRLFGIQDLKPIARLAELLTITSLSAGAWCIMADVGRPLRGLINLPRYARVSSPFFGDFTLVISGTFCAAAVYLYLSGRPDAAYLAERTRFWPLKWLYRLWALGFKSTPDDFNRHSNSSFWLALFILPMVIIAHSTLGFIFGIQASRPGWYSALQAPGFVVLAGISGTGILLVAAAMVRHFLHLKDVINEKAFKWLGIMLMILSLIYLYFMAVEQLTSYYAGPKMDREVASEVVSGVYAPYFWTAAGSLILAILLLFLQYVRGTTSIALHVLAGLLVNVAALTKRFVIVIPSQTHGMYLPYRHGSYFPTWVEFSVVAGLVAFGIMVFLVFLKIFPIVPLNTVEHEEPLLQVHLLESRTSHLRRLACFGLTLILGLGLGITGFLLSARLGADPSMDPILPFSPILFIAGITVCFLSAIVYEVVPQIPNKA